MPKVKVLKLYSIYSTDCYEYSNENILSPATQDWEEISDEKLSELQDALYAINYQTIGRNNFRYVLVTYSETSVEEVFKSYDGLMATLKRVQEERDKKKEAEKAKRAEKALERKRKQLEKLKRELE